MNITEIELLLIAGDFLKLGVLQNMLTLLLKKQIAKTLLLLIKIKFSEYSNKKAPELFPVSTGKRASNKFRNLY